MSNCGARIYEGLIPLSSKATNLNDALYSGEDFELLFTLSPKEAKKVRSNRVFRFRAIGEIIQEKNCLKLIDKKNQAKIIQPKGWRHF